MPSIRRSLLAAAACLLAAPAHAVFIDFEPAVAGVSVGEALDVDIVVGGLDAAGDAVAAFDLFIDYDPRILAPTTVAFGPGADASFAADTIVATGITFDLGFGLLGTLGLGSGGPLNVSALSLAPPLPDVQGDSVLLARLTFEALAAGFSALSFLNYQGQSQPLDVSGSDPAAPLQFGRVGIGGISVTAPVSVPEPGVPALLGAGLVLLGAARRRRELHP